MMRHLTQAARAVTALLTLIGFTFGVPAGLVAYVGWPLPTTLPTVDQIQLAVRSGIDPQLLVNTLAVIVWIVWAQLAVAVTVEVTAALRGRVARRLRLLPGLQPAAAQLIAAITLTAATIGPLRTVPVAAAPLPASIAITTAQPALHHEAPAASGSQTQPEQRSEPGPTYRVAARDTLWSIAETTLGDGRRWHDIQALNQDRIMGDGHRFTATTDRLTPGWLLVLPDDATTPPADQPDQTGTTRVTVEAGDSFWTIAKTTLTDAWGRTPSDMENAGYWNQLIDTNRHRLAPPHDPDLIFPGQHFDPPPIPADPELKTAPSERSDHPPSDGTGTVTVEPGNSFWSIAQSTLADAWDRTPTSEEITGFWRKLVDVNLERLAPPHDPNLIYPGQIFGLPAIPDDPRQADSELGADNEPTPETTPAGPDDADTVVDTPSGDPPPTATTSTVPAAGTATTITTPSHPLSDSAGESAADEPTGSDEDDSDDETGVELAPIASTLAGLGLLAAGLIALLRRLRNVQFRHRRADTIPTPPPAHTVPMETMIRTAAAPTSAELIDLALRAMARDVLATHRPPPQVVGVHLDAERLRLLLWTPHQNPPSGWHVEDEGRSWTLRTDVDINRLADMAKGVPAPYPALVTVGHADHTQLLVDLEFMGATQITGTPDDMVATCYTMATELAASPIADDLQIVCIGFGDDLAGLERVHVVDDLSEILPTLSAKTEAVSRLTAPSPLHGRLTSAGADTWDPIIVFDPTTEPPRQAGRLLTDAHTGRGVAAVVGYPTGDRWQLHIDTDTIRVEPLGLTLARRNLTPAEQTAVGDLIAAAKDLDGVEPDITTDPFMAFETIEEPPAATEETKQQPLFQTDGEAAGTIESPIPQMKVLGTLRVDGIDGRFPLRKCTELVAYLTFHRGGVEADTLMEVLWPEQRPDYQRLNRHTSRTRTTLGLDPDGQLYLPYVADGIYRISRHLNSDIEKFTGHIRQADQTSGTAQAHHLRAALELVEGTPFTAAGNAYTWAHTNGIITHAIVAIDNAAHRLAQHALANDDPDQATWAARKGLLATGACEECYRNLMRAASAEGNQVAFEAIYTELLAVVDADEGPNASSFLDPETTELYEQESRKRRRQAG
ncbi:MAG: LysM peptidoglycan-binding domain-containing protein [Acidimicrobiia bacterium]